MNSRFVFFVVFISLGNAFFRYTFSQLHTIMRVRDAYKFWWLATMCTSLPPRTLLVASHHVQVLVASHLVHFAVASHLSGGVHVLALGR